MIFVAITVHYLITETIKLETVRETKLNLQ